MIITETDFLSDTEKEAIRGLWNLEYPASLHMPSIAEFDRYLGTLCPWHWILRDSFPGAAGWGCVFEREGEQWLAMILHPRIQHQGYGAALMNKMKRNRYRLNGWVIDHEGATKADGTPYLSPRAFYEKQGFVIVRDRRLENSSFSAVLMQWSI
jgi:GNAT superfamily N-acetyltransferase